MWGLDSAKGSDRLLSGRHARAILSVCSLSKHVEVCKRTTRKKRKVFDQAKKRLAGTEAAEFQAIAKKTDAHYEKKLRSKKGNWRQKHEEFIAAIRAAKTGESAPVSVASRLACGQTSVLTQKRARP